MFGSPSDSFHHTQQLWLFQKRPSLRKRNRKKIQTSQPRVGTVPLWLFHVAEPPPPDGSVSGHRLIPEGFVLRSTFLGWIWFSTAALCVLQKKTFFPWNQPRSPTEGTVGLFFKYLLKLWDLFQKKTGGREREGRQEERQKGWRVACCTSLE